MPGQIPPFALLPSWKYILVTSSHHVVCLQCLSLPSWAACMFVFGFVADSLAAATAGPLLGQFSDWKCWRLENLTEEVVAGGKWPLYSSFGCAFIFAVLEPLQSACPPLTPAVVFYVTASCSCQWKVLRVETASQWKQPVSGLSVTRSSTLEEDNKGGITHLLPGLAPPPCHTLTQAQD